MLKVLVVKKMEISLRREMERKENNNKKQTKEKIETRGIYT